MSLTCALPAGLTAEDLDALGRNGFVSAEPRKNGMMTYKLRWRVGGRQRVEYLGSDEQAAARVAAAVAALQGPGRTARALAREVARARAELRRLKAESASTLETLGYRYHGFCLRRTRSPAATRNTTPIVTEDRIDERQD